MIKNLHHAELWIGPNDYAVQEIKLLLQSLFCKNNGCKQCTICNQIENKQHPNVVWLYPEKNYTVEQTRTVIKQISLKLSPDEKFFFIFQKADFLTDATSNSLLKSIEEPPNGYHFIFIAQRKDIIISTIRSRCMVRNLGMHKTDHEQQNFIDFFRTLQSKSPELFIKELEKIKPSERESLELLDEILLHWLKKYKESILKNEEADKIEKIINPLKNAMKFTPMPGSSKLFWKNLFLQLNR